MVLGVCRFRDTLPMVQKQMEKNFGGFGSAVFTVIV